MSVQSAKVVSIGLSGLCAVLLLLALAMQFGFGRGYSWLPPDEQTGTSAGVSAIDRTAFKLPPESAFAATQQRPLFNADRQPTPDTPDEPDTPPPPQVPLNIALTGVILTPDLRVAMVHDKLKNTNVALKEGMPMEGDQGGWTLTKVNARSAVFRETSGDEVEVELSAAVASPSSNPAAAEHGRAGAPVVPPRSPVAAAPSPQAQALQKRIEERREQMRAEAERLREQKKQQQQ
jgi:general secretion pathway protein N